MGVKYVDVLASDEMRTQSTPDILWILRSSRSTGVGRRRGTSGGRGRQ